MLLTFLYIFQVILIAIMIAAVVGIVLLGAAFAVDEYTIYRDSRPAKTVNARIKRMLRDLELRVQRDLDRKARLLKHKEETATGGFFEESFEQGFNKVGTLTYRGEHRLPSSEVNILRKKMDDAAADVIFKTVEEGL